MGLGRWIETWKEPLRTVQGVLSGLWPAGDGTLSVAHSKYARMRAAPASPRRLLLAKGRQIYPHILKKTMHFSVSTQDSKLDTRYECSEPRCTFADKRNQTDEPVADTSETCAPEKLAQERTRTRV